MARDVASLNQQLSELKASIAQLKASPDQHEDGRRGTGEAGVASARLAGDDSR